VQNNITVFHHNDPDGYCAKFWFHFFHFMEPYCAKVVNVSYFEYAYGSIENIELIKDNTVYFLDCSPANIADVESLKAQGNKIIIIDHHATAYDRYKEDSEIELYYDVKHSGCELTRLYFQNKYTDGEALYPTLFSKLIEDWDIWKFELDNTEEFIFGLQSQDIKDMKVWEELLYEGTDEISKYISIGKHLIAFRKNMAEIIIKNTGQEIYFHGFSCYAINNCLPSSKWFLDKAKEYDCILNWAIQSDGKVKISLYSEFPEKVQAGKLLEKYYGGGGHAGAAGAIIERDRFFKNIFGW